MAEGIGNVDSIRMYTAGQTELEQFWNRITQIMESKMQSPSYQSWIQPLKPYRVMGDEFIILSPDLPTKSTIEHRHMPLLSSTINAVMGAEMQIRTILPQDIDAANGNIVEQITDPRRTNTNIINKYVFNSFIKGKCNEMAYAASVAVAESPGTTTYNPLFLYGGVGLGKTHLMQAIGNHILSINPDSIVFYTTSEEMTNEFIQSLKHEKTQQFRDKYRKIDVLLIDDIQFLVGKDSTQEEFFHTFNALYNDNKQIVLSSDRPPSELKTLEKRLTSRFGSGLIVDITFPDYETRTAILEQKSEQNKINIPKEVIRYISQNISSNIRELEGALTKVTAYSILQKMPITLESAEKALRDIVTESEKKVITVEFIQKTVSESLGITIEDLLSKKRVKNITEARHIAMYLCRMMLNSPLLEIGRNFGGRDHTTVIHACDKVSEEIENRVSFKELIVGIEKKIKSES